MAYLIIQILTKDDHGSATIDTGLLETEEEAGFHVSDHSISSDSECVSVLERNTTEQTS